MFLAETMGEEDILNLMVEMQVTADTIKANGDIAAFIASPAVSREKKREMVRVLAEKGGFSRYTVELLNVLISRNREDIIVDVARELHFIADRILNRIRVHLTTVPGSLDSEVEGMTGRIRQYFGQNVFVDHIFDPAIIGGFIMEGDGKRIDMSVRGQLEKLLTTE